MIHDIFASDAAKETKQANINCVGIMYEIRETARKGQSRIYSKLGEYEVGKLNELGYQINIYCSRNGRESRFTDDTVYEISWLDKDRDILEWDASKGLFVEKVKV